MSYVHVYWVKRASVLGLLTFKTFICKTKNCQIANFPDKKISFTKCKDKDKGKVQ